MNDRDAIAIIASEIVPNAWHREDRRKRYRKPQDKRALLDFKEIGTAERKAARIIKRLRAAGLQL